MYSTRHYRPRPYLSYKYVVFLRINHFSMDTAHFIHLKYGIDKRREVMLLESRYFTTAHDVLENVKYKFKHCVIHLYNGHRVQLKSDDDVEQAREYTVKRQPLK